MRCEWLTQNKSDSLILFFNGWGMTSKSIEHLTAENARTRAFDCLHFLIIKIGKCRNLIFPVMQKSI